MSQLDSQIEIIDSRIKKYQVELYQAIDKYDYAEIHRIILLIQILEKIKKTRKVV